MNPFEGKRVLLGVTGSIACYKAVDLASKLTQLGIEVDVVLSDAATKFVTPLTFQSVTGRRAYIDQDLWGPEGHVLHVGLSKDAHLIAIAPVTANTIAKLANGQSDNLITLAVLAGAVPLLLAPAMDGGMYDHPATQQNLKVLRERGAQIVGPASGHLASGLSGQGRMVEPAELVGYIRQLLGSSGPLAGKDVVVTAGGTQEAIDPVRFIANRSSGKQGYAIAQAALDLGANVTLISGPTSLTSPIGAQLIDVTSAAELHDATLAATKNADALIMAAAVADFRVRNTSQHKIKRTGGVPELQLETNSDILRAVNEAKRPRVVVGFAAESRDLLENAGQKLQAKNLDLIIANDISAPDAGFEVDTNRVTILAKSGAKEELPLMSKDQVARAVMARITELLN